LKWNGPQEPRVQGEATFRPKEVEQIIDQAKNSGRINLLENEAKEICIRYGIPVPEFVVARTAGEAVKSADKFGYPVVLKIVSPDIIHKTEAGGVLVGLKDSESVESGFGQILENAKRFKPGAEIAGVLVQKMAPQGTEVIVGATKDPQFGQTVMFGIGGIFVEILKDVTFRVAPITKIDAVQMIHEIKAYPLLKGYRNLPPADEQVIADTLQKVSALVMDFPEISEVDLNPTMVYAKGASVVDARIILEKT
jgi:acyl-CoA synthetase (NDP forming)